MSKRRGRKKPTSTKARREQMKERRRRKQQQALADDETASLGGNSDDDDQKHTANVDSSNNPGYVEVLQLGDLRTVFSKEDKESIEKRKRRSQLPFTRRQHDHSDVGAYYEDVISMPVRPPWKHTMSKQQIDAQELSYFKKYVKHLYDAYGADRLNYFEHNLEVWRQLWRTCEISDILLVVADARHPGFHLPPSLYHYVTQTLGKPLVLVINKIDLVPQPVLQAWVGYLRKHFPALTVSLFSSFPNSEKEEKELLNSASRHRVIRHGKKPAGIDALQSALQPIVEANASLKALFDNADPPHTISLESQYKLPGDESDDEAADKDSSDDETSAGLLAMPAASHSTGRYQEKREKAVAKGNRKALRKHLAKLRREAMVEYSAHVGSDHPDEQLPLLQSDKSVLTLGMLGHPNAGKSSLINALCGIKLVSVSSTPGHTKHIQTILLNQHVRLCDCPGLVFPAVDMPRALQVLCGLYPIAQTREPYSAVQLLCEHIPLERMFGLLPIEVHEAGLHTVVGASGAQATGNSHKKKKKKKKRRNRAPDTADAADTKTADASSTYEYEWPKYEWSAFEICHSYALFRHYHNKRGGADTYRAANELLRMALAGSIVLYFSPPDGGTQIPLPEQDTPQ